MNEYGVKCEWFECVSLIVLEYRVLLGREKNETSQHPIDQPGKIQWESLASRWQSDYLNCSSPKLLFPALVFEFNVQAVFLSLSRPQSCTASPFLAPFCLLIKATVKGTLKQEKVRRWCVVSFTNCRSQPMIMFATDGTCSGRFYFCKTKWKSAQRHIDFMAGWACSISVTAHLAARRRADCSSSSSTPWFCSWTPLIRMRILISSSTWIRDYHWLPPPP